MSMVPSEAYFDGDPDGARADQVVSGLIVSVMMFALATGFAVVAFFAFQQMRGGVSVAAASEVLSRVANGPASVEDAPSSEPLAINPDRQPPPTERNASNDPGVEDTAAASLSPAPTERLVPTVKPPRTRAPTVTFDSSILDDVDPPAEATSIEAPSAQQSPPAPSLIDRPTSDEIAPAEETIPLESSAPESPPQQSAPVERAIAEADPPPAQQQDAPAEQVAEPEAPPAASAGADPPVVAQPEETQLSPVQSPNADAGPVDALAGTHLVQVGSFRSEDEAEADWRRIERRFPALLVGKARHVAAADLGERGVFYRLRIGPFASVKDARTHCQALKDGGQDCLAVRQ